MDEREMVGGGRKCDYCDGTGEVETDNNGPIGPCPMCRPYRELVDNFTDSLADCYDELPED